MSAKVQRNIVRETGSTRVIRKECEKRIEVAREAIVDAAFLVVRMNPRDAAERLREAYRYAHLASLDADELTRRLLPSQNSQ